MIAPRVLFQLKLISSSVVGCPAFRRFVVLLLMMMPLLGRVARCGPDVNKPNKNGT